MADQLRSRSCELAVTNVTDRPAIYSYVYVHVVMSVRVDAVLRAPQDKACLLLSCDRIFSVKSFACVVGQVCITRVCSASVTSLSAAGASITATLSIPPFDLIAAGVHLGKVPRPVPCVKHDHAGRLEVGQLRFELVCHSDYQSHHITAVKLMTCFPSIYGAGTW